MPHSDLVPGVTESFRFNQLDSVFHKWYLFTLAVHPRAQDRPFLSAATSVSSLSVPYSGQTFLVLGFSASADVISKPITTASLVLSTPVCYVLWCKLRQLELHTVFWLWSSQLSPPSASINKVEEQVNSFINEFWPLLMSLWSTTSPRSLSYNLMYSGLLELNDRAWQLNLAAVGLVQLVEIN